MSDCTKRAVGKLHVLTQAELVDFASSLDGLRNLIEGLRGGMKFHYGFDVIRKIVDAIITAYCRDNCYASYALPRDLTYVRARQREDLTDIPQYAHELGAPEPAKVKGHGRCNVPNIPVLYCSLLKETALAELDAQLGDVFTLATYKSLEEETVFACHVGEIDYFRRTGGLTYLGDANKGDATHLEDLMEGKQWDKQCLLDAFLAEEFIALAKSQSDYRITSAFCNILWNNFHSKNGLDAIMYPSVAFRDGKNVAFNVNAEKYKLELLPCKTTIVKVQDMLGFGMYRLKVIARLHSVEQNDNLKWERL